MAEPNDNPLAYLTEYDLRHLTTHLTLSGRTDDLHRLLQLEWIQADERSAARTKPTGRLRWLRGEQPVAQRSQRKNAWHANKEAIGDIAGYLADLERARRLAEETFSTTDSPNSPRGAFTDVNRSPLVLQIRYALMTASLNSLAGNLPPRFLAACVANEIWPLAQGLAYARQIPVPGQRAVTLSRLAQHFTEPLKTEIFQEALTAIQQIEEEENRSKALLELVPVLPGTLLPQTLTLAQHLPAGYLQSITFLALIEYLPDDFKVKAQAGAFAAIRAIPPSDDLADALSQVARFLPEPRKRETLQSAIKIARQLPEQGAPGEYPRSATLAKVARQAALLGYHKEALATLWAISDPGNQAQALSWIAPYLPAALIREVAISIWTTRHTSRRLALLLALAPYLAGLSEKDRAPEGEATRFATSIIELTPYLPPELHRAAFSSAVEIQDARARLRVFVGLVNCFSGPPKQEALKVTLDTARKIREQHLSLSEFQSLIRLAELGCHDEAIRLADSVRDPHTRAAIMAVLSAHLPLPFRDKALQQALTAAQKIEDPTTRLVALAGFCDSLPASLLKRTLGEASKIESRALRERVVAMLLSRFTETGEVKKALETAQALQEPSAQAQALAGISPYLAEPSRSRTLLDMLRIVREVETPDDQLRLVSDVLDRLPQALLEEALITVQQMRSSDAIAAGLAALAPGLPDYLLKLALATAYGLKEQTAQEAALAALLPRLAEFGRASEALIEIRQLHRAIYCAAALGNLGPRLAELYFPDRHREDLRSFTSTQGTYWWQLGSGLARATGADRHAAVQEARAALSAAQSSVRHTAEAKKALAQQLLRDSLTIIRGIKDEKARVAALAGVVPYLSTSQQKQVLAIITGITRESQRARALVGIAPYLPALLVQEAIALARTIQDPDGRAEALLAIAGQLSDERRLELWREALAAAMVRWLPHCLTSLRDAILQNILALVKVLGGTNGLAHILDSLAPYLSKSMLRQAVPFAHAIKDGKNRARTVMELAPYFPQTEIERLLVTARQTEDAEERAWALTKLLTCLPASATEQQVRQEALSAIRMMEYVDDRAEMWLTMIGLTPKRELLPAYREALIAAHAIQINSDQALVLAQLAPYAPEPQAQEQLLTEALALASDIEEDFQKAYVLVMMAPRMVECQHTKDLLELAQSISESSARLAALCGLAPRSEESLSGKALQQIFITAHSIQDAQLKAAVLLELLTRAPEEHQVDVFRDILLTTLRIQETRARGKALQSLLCYWTKLSLPVRYGLWRQALPVLAARTREGLLPDLRSLTTMVVALDGQEAALGVYQAIRDVGRWWP